MTVLQEHYQVKANWTGTRYIGIHLAWDYKKGQVHLYMPVCATGPQAIPTHLQEDTKSTIPPHRNQIWSQNSVRLTGFHSSPCQPHGKLFIQKVLTPISAIASQSANPTKETLAHTNQLPDYIATQEDAVLTNNRSDMVMGVHGNASYLSEQKSKSQAGGHFFMSTRHSQHRPHLQARHDVRHKSRTRGTIHNGT